MKNVLVIVDYQKDFVDGALGFETAPSIDSGIKELAEKFAEDKDGIIVCTYDTHKADYLETQEGKKLPVEHCIRKSEGWELYGETGKYIYELYEGLAPMSDGKFGDCVMETDCTEKFGTEDGTGKLFLVEKPTFPSLRLGDFLKELNNLEEIGSITLVGLVTNMCVMGNAIVAKAACPEAEIIIKKDLVDSFDKELHQKALDVMASMQMIVE